jgi:hypothetical protein
VTVTFNGQLTEYQTEEGSVAIQHLAHNTSDLVTVTFNGQLTEYQTEEGSVAGGYPMTDAVMNNIAEILLGLFVPWDKLPLLFLQHATQLNPYTLLWTAVEPTLPPPGHISGTL